MCCLIAVTGCTKPKQPGTLPPLSSASPSPSTSPSAAKPADAKAAIVALAKAYYDESNTAIRTGSTKTLREISVPGCPCNGFADQVDADWKRGTVPVSRYYTVIRVDKPVLRSPTVGLVSLVYRTNDYKVIDKTGHAVVNIPVDPKLKSSIVECHRTTGGWKVADVVRT